MERYVALVCDEIAATRRLGTAPLQTVFFGGGVSGLLAARWCS
jgi:coproporphyrinogen III oxidase-like Fe-S oxidoreductase